MSAMKSTPRYPGTRPFEESDKSLFYGRDNDIDKLGKQIKLEQLIVLFGKSGLGKSSLLNAGVLPHLKDSNKFLNLPVRLQKTSEDSTPYSSFISKIQPLINFDLFFWKNFPGNFKEIWFETHNESSFWLACKSLQLQNNGKSILIVFDQFEELFMYKDQEIQHFARFIATLISGEMPQALQDHIYKLFEENEFLLDEGEVNALFEKVNVKIVCSIRSDRMSLLDRLKKHIPQILQKTYELKPLSIEQATEALLKPASAPGDFISPPFEYEKQSEEKIINYLSSNREKQIEAFQLQLICQFCENLILKQFAIDSSNLILKSDDIGDLDTIFERHYENLISEIPENQRYAAQILIEENMIIEGNRVPLPDKVIISKHHIQPELLQTLVESRLLRTEPNSVGGISYEISHDTLIEPILKTYKQRKLNEEREKAEAERTKELMIARKKAEKELAERLKERKRQGRIILIVSIAASISIALAIVAFIQMQRAKKLTYKISYNDAQSYFEKEEFATAQKKFIYMRDSIVGGDFYNIQKKIDSCLSLKTKKTSFYKTMNEIDSLNQKKDLKSLVTAKQKLKELRDLNYPFKSAQVMVAEKEDKLNTLVQNEIKQTLGRVDYFINADYKALAIEELNKALELDSTNEAVLKLLKELKQ